MMVNPIGIIQFNTCTGKMQKCPVFSTFWSNSFTPDEIDCYKYLTEQGYGMIRRYTITYTPLVPQQLISTSTKTILA